MKRWSRTAEYGFLFALTIFLVGCWGGPDIDPSGARSSGGHRTGTPGTGQTGTGTDAPWGQNGNTYNLPENGNRPDGMATTRLGAPMVPTGEDWEIDRSRRWVPVYFAYNQSVIGETERGKLSALCEYLLQNPQYQVVVEGHCDERGSEEYNRGLGERRAISVKDYMESLGVDATRIRTLSYGEERPADPGNTEAAYARNRRAEFVILLPKE